MNKLEQKETPMKRAIADEEDLNELFNLKMNLNRVVERYIEAKVDVSLKSFYNDLSLQLTQKIVDEIDKQTSKVVEKLMTK